MTPNDLQAFSLFLAIAGASVGLASLLNNRHQQGTKYLDFLNKMDEEFWKDEEMARVRSWLVNDDAYSKVRDVFERRMNRAEVTEEEYVNVLDVMDKFLSMQYRIMQTHPYYREQERVLCALYYFWLERLHTQERRAMGEYSAFAFRQVYEHKWNKKVEDEHFRIRSSPDLIGRRQFGGTDTPER